jgi:hypothetical protein
MLPLLMVGYWASPGGTGWLHLLLRSVFMVYPSTDSEGLRSASHLSTAVRSYRIARPTRRNGTRQRLRQRSTESVAGEQCSRAAVSLVSSKTGITCDMVYTPDATSGGSRYVVGAEGNPGYRSKFFAHEQEYIPTSVRYMR